MKPREWQLVAVILENCWKGDWDDARAASYFVMLEPFDAAEVERALHLLARNGSPFIPSVPEIITAIDSQRASSVPTWPEALGHIRKVIGRCGRAGQERGIAQLAEAHEYVGSFAATYGWARLCGEPIDDPDHGGAVLRRLEVSYSEHVERMQDRERQGVAIETVARRSLSGPRRIDPAVTLGMGRADVAQG